MSVTRIQTAEKQRNVVLTQRHNYNERNENLALIMQETGPILAVSIEYVAITSHLSLITICVEICAKASSTIYSNIFICIHVNHHLPPTPTIIAISSSSSSSLSSSSHYRNE
uniref:Uncharacterized protein n=1 Tax=Glossina pallidipes TaxID=7398 RepID=A0A1A9ZPK4_GLOPL